MWHPIYEGDKTTTNCPSMAFIHPDLSYKHGTGHPSSNLPTPAVAQLLLIALLRMVLGLLGVVGIQAPGLNLTVNESTGKTSDDLLGLGVARLLAYCEMMG